MKQRFGCFYACRFAAARKNYTFSGPAVRVYILAMVSMAARYACGTGDRPS